MPKGPYPFIFCTAPHQRDLLRRLPSAFVAHLNKTPGSGGGPSLPGFRVLRTIQACGLRSPRSLASPIGGFISISQLSSSLATLTIRFGVQTWKPNDEHKLWERTHREPLWPHRGPLWPTSIERLILAATAFGSLSLLTRRIIHMFERLATRPMIQVVMIAACTPPATTTLGESSPPLESLYPDQKTSGNAQARAPRGVIANATIVANFRSPSHRGTLTGL